MKKITEKIISLSCALSLTLMPSGSLITRAQSPQQDREPSRKRVEKTGSQEIIIIEGQDSIKVQSPQIAPLPPMPSGNFDIFIGGNGGALGSETFQFVSSEMSFTSKLVKGAPYSAEAVTESAQTLLDGNRIVHRDSSMTYRDSEGRTRREQSLGRIGPLAVDGEPLKMIFIHDPVEGVSYTLNPREKEATKTTFRLSGMGSVGESHMIFPNVRGPEWSGSSFRGTALSSEALREKVLKRIQPVYPPIAKAAGAQGTVQVQVQVNENGDVIDARVVSGHPLLRDAAQEAARQWKFKATQINGQPAKVHGNVTFTFTLRAPGSEDKAETKTDTSGSGESGASFSYSFSSSDEQGQVVLKRLAENQTTVKKESLGKQMIEGVEAEGTRMTRTIPAGEIGNERPIDIVTEIWRSPELQVDVLRRTTDPRSGENTYKLTNIIRAEPDQSLFKLPEGYSVRENKGFFFNSRIRQKKEDE